MLEFKKWQVRERYQATEIMWRGFYKGNVKRGKGRWGQASRDKNSRREERSREWERERERRWIGSFKKEA